ncbi:hypothetical protein ACR6HW_17350 [Fusibacter sp. JL298sf-3]
MKTPVQLKSIRILLLALIMVSVLFQQLILSGGKLYHVLSIVNALVFGAVFALSVRLSVKKLHRAERFIVYALLALVIILNTVQLLD